MDGFPNQSTEQQQNESAEGDIQHDIIMHIFLNMENIMYSPGLCAPMAKMRERGVWMRDAEPHGDAASLEEWERAAFRGSNWERVNCICFIYVASCKVDIWHLLQQLLYFYV